MKSKTHPWRRVLTLAGLALALLLAIPLGHLLLTALRDRPGIPPVPPGYGDDVSHLNRTQLAQVIEIAPHLDEAITQLRPLLALARKNHLKIALAGAKHSQGGQTLYPGALSIDMLPLHDMGLDISTGILKVGAGCRWFQIIPYLDEQGRSVAIMQSDDNFSVGGSLSVNCHGWQPNRPPIASTVRALTVMTADGRVLRCDREHHRELFSLVLGGYGLFGIILQAEIQTVPNALYRLETENLPSAGYAEEYARKVAADSGVGMAYGRLSVVPGHFLEEASLNIYRPVEPQPSDLPELEPGDNDWFKRLVFRGSVGSGFGKALRWVLEQALGEHVSKKPLTRNQLEYSDASFFMNRSPGQTDILQEYFLPPGNLQAMVEKMAAIIPKYQGDLLNVTIRQVLTDPDSFMAYARGERFALVLFLNQSTDAEGEKRMQGMTRELIDAALSLGGTYYLPYRLAATPEQFAKAYPMADKFFALKKRYDPEGIFQNEFYKKYGLP